MEQKNLEAQVEDSFENKSAQVRNHIRTVGYITSWEAIEKYSATRLSAIIFNARKENGGEMNIGKYDAYNTRIDERGKKHTTRFAVYYDADKYTEDDIHLMSYL